LPAAKKGGAWGGWGVVKRGAPKKIRLVEGQNSLSKAPSMRRKPPDDRYDAKGDIPPKPLGEEKRGPGGGDGRERGRKTPGVGDRGTKRGQN